MSEELKEYILVVRLSVTVSWLKRSERCTNNRLDCIDKKVRMSRTLGYYEHIKKEDAKNLLY